MAAANPVRDQTLEDILASIQKMITEGVDALEGGASADRGATAEAPGAVRGAVRSLRDPTDAARNFLERFGAGDEDLALVDPRRREPVVLDSRRPPAPVAQIATLATMSPPRAVPPQAAGEPSSALPETRRAEAAPREADAPRPQPLLSEAGGEAVAGSFDALSRAAGAQAPLSVDDLMRELLRPMLREWLDANLPGLVEDLVRQEIERIARNRR